jgi:Protein of unknown function (DUF1579)
MQVTLQKEHQWLHKLIGEWIYESECRLGPDQTPSKTKGTEIVRSLGGLWIVAEGEGEMPDGETGKTIMSLGYDPQSDRYIGTFVCSMMSHLWLYNGSLDPAAKVLTLDTEGPSCSQDSTDLLATYQDIITFVSDDHRILRSQILGSDGNWHQFMIGNYWRKL